jgi:hypothetical protein
MRAKTFLRRLTSGRQAKRVGVALLVAISLLSGGAVFAATPEVQFDTGYLVECRDVTPQAFALLHPREKVVEASLRVSVRLAKGEEKDIEELQFELTSPAERLRVVDFLPRTQIESESIDGIEVVKTTESIHSLGAGVGTTLSFSGGAGGAHGTVLTQALPNANANSTHRKELKETSKKLPPGKAVIISGTLENEHGVFYKLRRSATDSFEGTKLLSFRFVVPADWRGDWVVLSSEARGRTRRNYFFKSVAAVGESKAFIGLYLAGDETAERAALGLAEAQEQYFASKVPAERYDLMITTLATEARPWRAASHTKNMSDTAKSVTCYKPVAGRKQKHSGDRVSGETACGYLRQTLDRVAGFSSAPGWHADTPRIARE